MDLGVDLVEGAGDVVGVGFRRRARPGHLPQPLGRAVNVGQAVRDVLEGPLGQAAGGRHLAGVLQLLVEKTQVPALGLQPPHQGVGGEQHGGDDQQRPENEGEEADPAGAVEAGENIRPVRCDDAHPGHGFLPGHSENALAARLDADPLKRRDRAERGFLQRGTGRPRTGLVHALAVDQVGLGLEIARARGNETLEEIGVHRGAQDPEAVRILLFDGDDEMGDLAVAQVDVADEQTLFDRGPEPEVIPVVARHQVVGTDVGPMVAFGVDDPQVAETGQLQLHGAVGPPEASGLP